MSAADRAPQCSLQFIGNATILLRLGPFTVLTDPNFLHKGQFAYLGYGLVSRRRLEPAMGPAELPELDAVVLSHRHGDHWDRQSRRGLDRSLPVVTTPQAASALRRQGFAAALGLTTWGAHELVKDGQTLQITAMPGRHARGVLQHLLPPVMGSMIEYRPAPDRLALRLYISGDTLFVEDLREIPRRYPDPDVAVLHLGGTRLPAGARLPGPTVTMDAAQGARLVELIGARMNVPVHYDDYGVFASPLSAFTAELGRRGLGRRVTVVERGRIVTLPLRPA